MSVVQSLTYLFITPINPVVSYRHLGNSNVKQSHTWIAFIFSCLLSVPFYYFNLPPGLTSIPVDMLVHMLGFTVGLVGKSLLTAYLLFVILNRMRLAKISWGQSFMIVTFAIISLKLGLIWYLVHPSTHHIGQIAGLIWNALLVMIGLKVLHQLPLWRGALAMMAILITLKFIEFFFVGVRI